MKLTLGSVYFGCISGTPLSGNQRSILSIFLRATFTRTDPKSTKRESKFQYFFALLGSLYVKAALKMLMKLTPSVGIID